MKHRILSLISKKPNSFWEYFDLVYIGIIGFFILALIYEGVSFLLSYYTFSRMLGALALCSVLYVFSVFQRSPRDIKKITQSYVSHPYVVFAVSRRKELLYGSVIVYLGVFLSGFVVGFGSIFTYATYAVMGVFVVYKILGGKLGRTLRDPGIQQKTFFKILVLSVSIFITCIGVTLDAYEITDHKTLILLVTSLAYVLGFTYVFSDILQNV